MPCFIVLIAFFFPRVVLAGLFLFSTYLHNAYETVLWPVVGFFVLPFATLAYAFAMNEAGGLEGFYLVIFIVAILFDIGSFSSSTAVRQRR
ncbi:MAG: hypothetical protein WD294_13905 [Phycisphaeraceae bacterium]